MHKNCGFKAFFKLLNWKLYQEKSGESYKHPGQHRCPWSCTPPPPPTRKRRRVHEIDSAKCDAWHSMFVHLSNAGPMEHKFFKAETHRANQEEPAQCWGSFRWLLCHIHTPPQAAFLRSNVSWNRCTVPQPWQRPSSCFPCAVLSRLSYAFVFQCASWSWWGSLVGAHSRHRNTVSHTTAFEILSWKLCDPVEGRNAFGVVFSSLLLMPPSPV